MSDFRIPEAVLDPVWRVDTIAINDSQITVLSVMLPVGKWEHFALPDGSADRLMDVLSERRALRQGIVEPNGRVG